MTSVRPSSHHSAANNPHHLPSHSSTDIAQSFSQDLEHLFNISKPLAQLNEKVEAKKRDVSNQTSELAALETRLRETEARLAHVTGSEKLPPSDAVLTRDMAVRPTAATTRTDSLGFMAVPGALPVTPAQGPEAEYGFTGRR